MNGDRKTEQAIHKQFSFYRSYGGWFLAATPLLDFIAALPKHGGLEIQEENLNYTAKTISSLKNIGELLQVARGRRNISCTEMARRLGVDRRTLADLEKGGPGVSTGVFFQALDHLGLLDGLEEIVRPENDLTATAISVYKVRRKLNSKKIDDSKVDF